jgi:hypothetical protein
MEAQSINPRLPKLRSGSVHGVTFGYSQRFGNRWHLQYHASTHRHRPSRLTVSVLTTYVPDNDRLASSVSSCSRWLPSLPALPAFTHAEHSIKPCRRPAATSAFQATSSRLEKGGLRSRLRCAEAFAYLPPLCQEIRHSGSRRRSHWLREHRGGLS